MLVICPLSACSSYEKRDEFLSLLSDIAIVTRANEPRTRAYAWFPSTGDNTEVPNHYVRGFEVYEDEAALVQVHRMSEPYKKMRSSVVPEKILETATDLRFLRPTGVGFMTRPGQTTVFEKDDASADESKTLVVVLEIRPKEGAKSVIMKDIEALADYILETHSETASFWPLEYLPEYSDDGITIFSRFKNESSYIRHLESSTVTEAMSRIVNHAVSMRTSRWRECGIGFVGR